MSLFYKAFGDISGGRILDVATGEGVFIKTLAANLKSYSEIIGIDVFRYTGSKDSPLNLKNIQFLTMDGCALGFENESFDTVSISSSLHHLEDISQCIQEMNRVLKPGGHFIIRETHQKIHSEPQLSDMYLHHWVAEIDSAYGKTHNKTFTYQELKNLINSFGLSNVMFYDVTNEDMNPFNETAIKDSEGVIERYLKWAVKLPNAEVFKIKGEEILEHIHRVGIQWEPELIAIGKKK